MFKRKCSLCSKKVEKKERRFYKDDQSKRIIVCLQCAEYADELIEKIKHGITILEEK